MPGIFEKTIKIKEPLVLVFGNAQRTGGFLGGYLSLSKNCKPRLYIGMGVFGFSDNYKYMRTRYLIFLRTIVINPKNHPDTQKIPEGCIFRSTP